MENSNSKSNNIRLKRLILTALFIALTYVFTAFVNIKLPVGNGGLIHLGNIPLFIGAILLGKKSGAVIGGVGMGLFDLFSGWVSWAPFTLVIVGLMGFTTGVITYKKNSYPRYIIAFAAAILIKIVGYYIAEGIIYSNWIAPAASILGNVIQVGVASILVLAIIKPLKKAFNKTGMADV